MSNKEITTSLKLMASLLELHGANPFKVRGYTGAIYKIDNAGLELAGKTTAEIQKIGLSKNMATKISDLLETAMFAELKELLDTTPAGVVEILNIKGLGAKKVRQLWQDLGLESVEALYEACQTGQLAKVKGFGAKTQEKIMQEIDYQRSNLDKLLLANSLKYADFLETALTQCAAVAEVMTVGQVRRRLPVVDQLDVLVATQDRKTVHQFLSELDHISNDLKNSGVFVWRGFFDENKFKINVHLTAPQRFGSELLLHSAALEHLHQPLAENLNLKQVAKTQHFPDEESIYKKVNLNFVPAETREGTFELAFAKEKALELIDSQDIKGVLHAHSTYSDGKNTLEDMAQGCIALGYEYLGITDHSQTAVYANGLQPYHIQKQQEEIDALNKKLAPFKIFKGIESDILGDGSLDYKDEILDSFDFVIASIHSALNMSQEKATERIIKAVENPYTTILGHLTGRLLLRREGYPLDMEAVIAACAENQVVIEINAAPSRLDLDWRWVHRALEQGVLLSINPDAHAISHYDFIRYGIWAGRKGGLTKEKNLNSLNASELTDYFKTVKSKKIK